MRREIATEEGRWIDIVQPGDDDFAVLRERFRFHPVDLDDARAASHLPKLQVHPTYLYLVVHIPVADSGTRAFSVRELDLFVSRETVVTLRGDALAGLDDVFSDVKTHEQARERYVGRGPAFLLYSILERLFDGIPPLVADIVRRLERDEEKIFSGAERAMVTELALLRRELIDIRSVLRPQRDMYEPGLLNGEWDTPAFRAVFRSLNHKLARLWGDIETLWERAEALASANEQLLNYKLNEFVKILTIISAVFIPLGLIAQVIVALHEDIPPVHRATFWGIILLMLVIDYVIVWNARRRNML